MAANTATPTPITPPRVPLIDARTGLIDRAWYLFFLSLFTTATNAEDPALGPPVTDTSGDFANLYSQTQLAVLMSRYDELQAQLFNVQQELETAPRQELGTMAALQQANLPWVTFDTTPDGTPPDVGTVAWDGGTTLGVQATANVLMRVGESEFVYVKASSAITKGQLCYHTGSVGASGVITAAPTPTGLTDPNQIVGVAAETIALNGFGLIQVSGDLRGFNTTGSSVGEVWADGDPLYYNPSFVGSMTKTKPTAPNQKTYIGEIINASSGGSGSINIRISPGSVLGGTDSNVQITSVANDDALIYVSANQRWENKAPTAARDALGLGTGNPTNGQLLIGNGTDFTTANLTAGNGIAVTNGAGTIAVATSLAAGTNISITGTTTQTIATTASITASLINNTGRLMDSSAAMFNGAGALVGTLTNSPVAGNPTKWVEIDDNGTPRYIPAW